MIDYLKNVLVLERILELNPSLPRTIEGMNVGRDIVFPTIDELQNKKHIVDTKTAVLFYETLDYYYAFELAFRDALEVRDVKEAFLYWRLLSMWRWPI